MPGLHILNSDEAKEDEYDLHLEEAREWREQLDKTRKPFLQVTTGISAAPNSSWKVNIPKQAVQRPFPPSYPSDHPLH